MRVLTRLIDEERREQGYVVRGTWWWSLCRVEFKPWSMSRRDDVVGTRRGLPFGRVDPSRSVEMDNDYFSIDSILAENQVHNPLHLILVKTNSL